MQCQDRKPDPAGRAITGVPYYHDCSTSSWVRLTSQVVHRQSDIDSALCLLRISFLGHFSLLAFGKRTDFAYDRFKQVMKMTGILFRSIDREVSFYFTKLHHRVILNNYMVVFVYGDVPLWDDVHEERSAEVLLEDCTLFM